MPLAAGTRLGVFEILAPLGKGGMGEVYRAKDTKLEREVAVKILPEEMAKRPERMARFEREAKLLAALNHPHIAAIHGLHEEDSQHFLVMELVDGQTLADRLNRGALPVPEALELGRQIAEALEAAHEKDIIHRDLKPSNVMLTSKGKAKVLDFGLGRVLERESFASSIDTATTPDQTGIGVVLGTAPYMSPEQARGEEVDGRTDIWAFGCVLYEALAGKRAFSGRTSSDTLAAGLEREPDWEALPPATPPTIRTLLRRCLRKGRARRIHSIVDAGIKLEDAPGEGADSAGAAAPRVRNSRWHWLAYGIAGGLMAAALLAGRGFWAKGPRPQQAPHSPKRLNVIIPRAEVVGGSSYLSLGLSPDGTRLASTARVDGAWGLYLRPLNALQATRISESGRVYSPFFSPDSRWLGFWDSSTDKLKKVSVDSGAPITLSDAANVRGASWGPDGTILFNRDAWSGLWRVPAEGGTPEELTRPNPEEGRLSHNWPDILPGGRSALFTVTALSGRQDEARIALLSLDTGEWRTLFEGGAFSRYVETGHIVYARNGSLLAVPFDLDRLEVTGAAVPILGDVSMNTIAWRGVAQFSISRSGALAYIAGSASVPERSLVWVDRQGRVEPVTEERRGFLSPRLSTSGDQLAVSVQDGVDADVWVYDLRRGTKTRLTFGKNNYGAVWTRDGRNVVFSSNRDGAFGLFTQPVDGSGSAQRLTSGEGQQPTSVSPDGRFLAYIQQDDDTSLDIWVLPLEGDREPQLVLRTPFGEVGGVFSPDGAWLAYGSLAYGSLASGQSEVYVQAFPGLGRSWTISTHGGQEPLWSPDGRELFYWEGSRLMTVPVQTQPTFRPGSPRVLLEGRYLRRPLGPLAYDITPDGSRFLMVQEPEEAAPEAQQIVYIPDFFDELKAKMAEAGQ